MKTIEGQPGEAINELDRTLALLGVLFTAPLTIWLAITIGRPIYVLVGILCFLACAGYLLIRRKLSLSTIPSVLQTTASPRFYAVLHILFLSLLSYSILSIYLSPEPYTRPLGYFISTALMAALVAVEILFLSSGKSHTYFALFKTIIIGLSLRWSQQLIFPTLVGNDPWWHQWFTIQILDAGRIPEGYAYSNLPVFHLISGAAMLITDLNYKMATMMSLGLLQVVCDSLFVFLLGRFIVNAKVGLLAALLLMVANSHIVFGVWIIPNTAGAVLILPIIYLLFKIRRDKPTLAVSLSLLLMGVLILTHTLVAMCVAILLFVFWAGFEVYARLYREKSDTPTSLTIALLFTGAMLGYWMYISGHIWTLAHLIDVRFYAELWMIVPLEEVARHMLGAPLSEQLFNNLGMLLFFTISFIGCLYLASRRFGNRYRFAIVIGAVVILALAFFPPLFGREIIVWRWIYLAKIMQAIPLGLALLLLCAVFKNKLVRMGLMSFAVFHLSFLMIMSPMANMDNHLFSPNTAARDAFTEAELRAAATISNVWDGKIGADRYYQWLIHFQFNRRRISIDDSLLAGCFRDSQGMLVLIRQKIATSPFRLPGGVFKLDYDPRHVLAEQGFSRIYENGSVSGFSKLPNAPCRTPAIVTDRCGIAEKIDGGGGGCAL